MKSHEIASIDIKSSKFSLKTFQSVSLQEAIQIGLNNHNDLPKNKANKKTIAKKLYLEITLAYYALQEAEFKAGIQKENIEYATLNLRDSRILEKAGLGTTFSVLLAEANLARANQKLTEAISKQKIARRNLAKTILLDAQTEVTAADELKEAKSWDLSLEDTLELSYQNYLKEHPNSSETSLDFYKIRLGIETAYYNFVTYQENIESSQKEIEVATEALRLSRLRFQAGVGTHGDIILAQTILLESKRRYYKSIINYNKSLAYLGWAVEL